ncbi:alpha-E domain-containing protein [filamentous cyanobacterium LEGE 11480]|uniref:Alpha-E domain-containing protein n=1 Tax=Romeriopsis navalis LEGE 11480 TaxID=2777977 RepID=A0A928VR60_9CYAN|nr:alpha-E domain-containing protein [Romeriopsis navalis]MBE9032232.1 alpha-E domain-containing protein [Romeriopsis navalis LEGE 11480]
MLSRVAESIYWMNRYIERAENIARFIEVNLNLLLDAPEGLDQQWEPIIATTGDREWFAEHYGEATEENVMYFLSFDKKYRSSILSCVTSARENARSIREIISSEMWEELNTFYFMVKDAAARGTEVDWATFFAEVKQASHLFDGLTHATMSHNEAWNFGRLGRYIERADKITRILDVKYFLLLPSPGYVGSALDELQWTALLRSASAYEMYRKSHRQHRLDPQAIAGFLLLDRQFPRSAYFCIQEAERSLYDIMGNTVGAWTNPAERNFSKLRTDLNYVVIEEVIEDGLHEFLARLQQRIDQLDDLIFATFFELEAAA